MSGNGRESERADIQDLGDGHFAIRSDLTFESASRILLQSKQMFASCDRISVEMSAAGEADSAGLALLLEWISWTRHTNREITYEKIPERLLAIARISEVSDLLGAASSKS